MGLEGTWAMANTRATAAGQNNWDGQFLFLNTDVQP